LPAGRKKENDEKKKKDAPHHLKIG
jgi:hypothetical protein